MKRAALLVALVLGPLIIAPLWAVCGLPGTEALVGFIVAVAMTGGTWAWSALIVAVLLYAWVVHEVWGRREG